MHYFKGDIVEIITARYKSWNEIPKEERGYYETQLLPAPTIGQRFEVKFINKGYIGAVIEGKRCLIMPFDCVMLVKRGNEVNIEAMLERAMLTLDDYLNAGSKELREKAAEKAKHLYKEYYGVDYINRHDR